MTYVPVVVPPQQPSPRTRELGDLLARVIEEYEKHHPSVTGGEVRAALQIAAQSSKAATPPAAAALVVGLVLLLLGLGAFFALGTGGLAPDSIPWVAVTLAFVSVIGVAFLLKRLAGK